MTNFLHTLKKGILKHFTLVNMIVGVFVIIFVGLIKYSSLAIYLIVSFGFSETQYNEYIITGFLALITKLGIKGIVQEMVGPYLEIFSNKIANLFFHKMKIEDILNPDSSSDNSGQSNRPEGGNRQVSSLPGNPEPSPGNSSQSNRSDINNLNRDFISKGYSMNGIDGKVRVHDPGKVADRGLYTIVNGVKVMHNGNQPYATNLANAMEEY